MLERVKEIIEEQLNLDGVEITMETRFKEDLCRGCNGLSPTLRCVDRGCRT